jgi:hypothetical protein
MHDLAEVRAVFGIGLRGPVHRGGQHAVLAIGRPVGHDVVDVPGIVGFYDCPSCVLLSQQTMEVRGVVRLCEESGKDGVGAAG